MVLLQPVILPSIVIVTVGDLMPLPLPPILSPVCVTSDPNLKVDLDLMLTHHITIIIITTTTNSVAIRKPLPLPH